MMRMSLTAPGVVILVGSTMTTSSSPSSSSEIGVVLVAGFLKAVVLDGFVEVNDRVQKTENLAAKLCHVKHSPIVGIENGQ